jgi:tRNA-2-methylthio-N6-dimethylallyladenosine synthase
MPLQSGSSRLLKEMRRSYRQQKFLDIIARVKEAIPDAAITTDIIVGFPGETEEDFLDTLHVVRESRFSGAFTFQYSKRPGTPAADLPSIDPAVIADRYQRLTALQTQIGLEENEKQVGRTVEVMVASGEGRRDGDTGRMSGRAPDNRLVHFNGTVPAALADGRGDIRPGDMVTVTITRGAPHYLEADGAILSLRRTRSGDAWERRTAAPAAPAGVGLGMPAIGVPAPLPPAVGCS